MATIWISKQRGDKKFEKKDEGKKKKYNIVILYNDDLCIDGSPCYSL